MVICPLLGGAGCKLGECQWYVTSDCAVRVLALHVEEWRESERSRLSDT
jgi:hypothetical protein